MAATFPNLDALIAAFPGQTLRFGKVSMSTEGGGFWHSFWKVLGNPGAGATPPAGGEVPTRLTAGAMPFANAAPGGRLHLGKATVASGSLGTLILYDRLWHNSGLSGAVTTAQTISSPPVLTRPDALGAGVELWGEVYTAMGATASNFTATYTNQDGVAGQLATYAMPANALSVGQMFPFALASGDTGVRSVSQAQLSANTGLAGDWGFVLLRRIMEFPCRIISVSESFDWSDVCLADVDNDACLSMMWFANSTFVNATQAFITLVES